MAEYISRKKVIAKFIEGDSNDEFTEGYNFAVSEYRSKIEAIPAADVQPLSVISVHLRRRLYAIAFNTNDEKAMEIIANIAEQIDIWLNEVKDGEK